MSVTRLLLEALLFGIGANLLLWLIMRFLPARVWGYSDYPTLIKEGIPPQTGEEKRLALIFALFWVLISFGFPIVRVLWLKSELGAEFGLGIAFGTILAYFIATTLIDLVVLDWWLITRVTPDYVVMEGTRPEQYKDLSQHYRSQLIAILPTTLIILLVAWIITIF